MTDSGAGPRLRGIVFDFDGVLADTEPLHLRACQEALAGTRLQLRADDYYARYLGYDDAGLFTALAHDQGVPIDAPELRRLVEAKSRRFRARAAGRGVLFPGAADCVERLAAAAPLAVASGALHAEIDLILDAAGLRRCFDAIVAADDVPRSKPAPDPYRRAVELLHGSGPGPDPSAWAAVEDSAWGIESAHAAGLWCVAVTHSYPADVLASADLVLGDLQEVRAALLRRLDPPAGATRERRA